MASAALTVPIDGSTKGLERALRDATGEVRGFGNRIKGTLKGIGGAFVAGFAGLQVAGLVGDAIGDASDLQEAGSKAGQIFGEEFMGSLNQFAGGAATELGLSEFQALDAASTFGVFGKAAGLAGSDLTGFSTEMTELAVDMASFNNTSPEEAIAAIGAGLRGESEPLRRFGVLMDQATLEAAALEQGIWDGEGAITAQEKSLAAAAVMMEQTTDQQGDFARTSGGLANQQKILRAQLANVSAEIGAKLLPVAVELATWFNESGLPAIKRFGGWLQDNIPPILQAIGDWFERHRDTINEVMEAIWVVIQRVWSEVQRYVESTLLIIQGVWNTFAGIFRGDWDQFWQGIGQILGGFWDRTKQMFSLGFEAFKFIASLGWEAIKDLFWKSLETLEQTVRDGLAAIVGWFAALPNVVIGALSGFAGMLIGVGADALNGLWQGMKNKAEEIFAWIRDTAGRMASAFADALKIWSPSRVFMGFGENIMEGLRIGLADGETPVARTMGGVADSLTAPMAGRSGATQTAGAGGTMTVVVELDGREIARSVERVSERDGGLRIKTRAGG